MRGSKRLKLKQSWFDVGPASATLAQHQTNIGSMITGESWLIDPGPFTPETNTSHSDVQLQHIDDRT